MSAEQYRLNDGQAEKGPRAKWDSYTPFCKHLHVATEMGVGASHQTGWTGLIARIMHHAASSDAINILNLDKDKSAGEPSHRMSRN